MDKIFKSGYDSNKWLMSEGFRYNYDNKTWIKRQLLSKPLVAKEYLLLGLDKFGTFMNYVVAVEIGEGMISKLHTDLFNKGLRTLNVEEYEKYERDGRSYKDQAFNVFVKTEQQGNFIVSKYFAIRYDIENRKLQLVDVTKDYNYIWSKEYYERLRIRGIAWGESSRSFFAQLKLEHWSMDGGWPEDDRFFFNGRRDEPIVLRRGNYIIEINPGWWSINHEYFIPEVKKIQ